MKQKLLLSVSLTIVVLASLWLLSSSTKSAESKPVNKQPNGRRELPQTPSNNVQIAAASRLQRGLVLPQLHFALKALGDRLDKPGKERLTLAGVLSQTGSSEQAAFSLVWELPGKLRVNIRQGLTDRTFIFNGEKAFSSDPSLNKPDLDLLETLVYDSAERFFIGQMNDTRPRALGTRFRMDDGTAKDYNGPYYDIYQVNDRVKTEKEPRSQTKLYLFNSDTQLLERVRYTALHNGTPVDVEVQISDWQPLQDQQVARRIARFENGSPVLTLAVVSGVVGPKIEDGIFDIP